jgi:hypothetical protein
MCKPYSWIGFVKPGGVPEFGDDPTGNDNHTGCCEANGIKAGHEDRCQVQKFELDMYSADATLFIDGERREWFTPEYEEKALAYARRRIETFRTISYDVDEIKTGNWLITCNIKIGNDTR